MRKTYRIVLVILLFLSCLETAGDAKEIGEKLNLTPTVSVQEIYDSNVFKLKNKDYVRFLYDDTQMDEFITVYSAGLEIDYPLEKQRLTINGKKEFVRYSHYNDLDFEKEEFNGRGVFKFGDGFFINPDYGYSNKNIPRLYNRNKDEDFLKHKNAGIYAGYKADTWKLSGILRRDDYDYKLNDNVDREAESIGGSFTLIPSADSRFYFKFTHKELDYNDDVNDNQVRDILIGASFILGGSSKLQLEGGQNKKTFSKRKKEKNTEDFNGNLSLLYQLSQDTTLSTKYSRITEEISYFESTSYHVTDSANVGLSWLITSMASTNLYVNHSWMSYKGRSGVNPLRWQRYLTMGWGFNYLPHKDIHLSLSYEFQQRESNSVIYEFEAHQVAMALSLSWK